MTRALFALALFLTLSQGQTSQDTPITDGMMNGCMWNASSKNERVLIYKTIEDANALCQSSKWGLSPRPLLSRSEMIELLDQFFADPVNRPVPIVYGYLWARGKEMGESEATLRKLADELRKTAGQ